MEIWAQVELALQLNAFHTTAITEPGWYRLAIRAYKQLREQQVAAVPINFDHAAYLTDDTSKLPKALLPLLCFIPDYDTYLSRPFYSRDPGHDVAINELARFMVELPALPSILHSSAAFVEVQLLLYHTERRSKSKMRKGNAIVEIVSSNVFRVANLGLCRLPGLRRYIRRQSRVPCL